jgi:hypothetical protein
MVDILDCSGGCRTDSSFWTDSKYNGSYAGVGFSEGFRFTLRKGV